MTTSDKKNVVRPLESPDFSRLGKGREGLSDGTSPSDSRSFFPLFTDADGKGATPAQNPIERKREKLLKEAEQTLLDARKKADEIAEKAYERGYAEGEKAGYEYGLKKVESMIQALSEAQKRIEETHRDMILTQEKEIISLILFIARKVIHTETKTNPEVLLSVLRKALEEVPHKRDLHIRLNPMDYEFYKKNVQKFVEAHEELKEAEIEPDSRVDLGGVIVDHRMGSVDARLSRQYEKIEKLFQNILEENQKANRELSRE